MKLINLLPPAAFWKASLCLLVSASAGLSVELFTHSPTAGFIACPVGLVAGYLLMRKLWGTK